jgi:hypothetical protein
MHISTFEYLKPTGEQLKQMEEARQRAFVYANALEAILPDGPDKTYIIRKLREISMWVNVAITRLPDGGPRDDIPF